MNGDEIKEEAKRRKAVGSGRLQSYRRSRAAYFGDAEERGQVKANDAAGRPLLEFRNELSKRTGAPNMLMPIVDDYVALKGVLPTMKVLPWDDSEDARNKCAKFSRLIRAQWNQSNMEVQWYRGGFYLTALGDALITLTPVFPSQRTPLRPAGIYLTVIDPACAFPRFKTGWDCEELDDVIVWERLDREVVGRRWGIWRDEEKVDVFHYISSEENTVSVDTTIVEKVRHDLGFCPAQWVKNKLNGRPAQSDIGPAIESHEEMQVMVLVMNDSLLEATYSQLVIKNPVNVQESFEVGPGAEPIVLQGDGDVSRLAPSPPPQAAQMLMHNMWEHIQRVAGSAPVRTENAISGSNVSGKSVHAQQGPMETRLAASQTVIGYHFASLNTKMLWMFWKLDEFRNEVMNVYGTEKGTPFSIQFRGAELNGWTRNTVLWSAIIGSTAHERSVVGLSLKKADLVPDEWVLEQIGIEDAPLLITQAKEEAKERMKMQQSMQQPPPGPQAPPQASPAAGPEAPPEGGSPAGATAPDAQPPASLPPFPPVDTAPTQGALGTPNPVPDVAAEISSLLNSVEGHLLGRVTNIRPVPGGVHITLDEPDAKSNNNDRMILRQVFSVMGSVTFSQES